MPTDLHQHEIDSYLALAHLRAALAVLPAGHQLAAVTRAAVTEAEAYWRGLEGQAAAVARARAPGLIATTGTTPTWPIRQSAPPRGCTTRDGARAARGSVDALPQSRALSVSSAAERATAAASSPSRGSASGSSSALRQVRTTSAPAVSVHSARSPAQPTPQ